jgi:hypothetical protein
MSFLIVFSFLFFFWIFLIFSWIFCHFESQHMNIIEIEMFVISYNDDFRFK